MAPVHGEWKDKGSLGRRGRGDEEGMFAIPVNVGVPGALLGEGGELMGQGYREGRDRGPSLQGVSTGCSSRKTKQMGPSPDRQEQPHKP